MQEQARRTASEMARRACGFASGQAKFDRLSRILGVAEGTCEELPLAVDGVLPPRHRNATLVEPGRGRFAHVPASESHPFPATGKGGDQGAFHQALGIEHQVVFAGSEVGAEGRRFPARVHGIAPPAPPGNGDHPLHPRMPFRDGLIGLLHHPIEAHPMSARRRDRWQGMRHVAQGGGLDQQGFHSTNGGTSATARSALGHPCTARQGPS